jgi:drug/metabolite transporter (DMT)-like permease
LLPLDIAWARIMGASIVLLPWAWWLNRQTPDRPSGSFGGLSPLPFRTTVIVGLFGGLSYSMFAYSGFFFAPAAHGSVLMPGFLPVWTSLLALALLGERLHSNRLMGLALIISGGMLVGGSSMLASSMCGGSGSGSITTVAGGLVGLTTSNQNTETQYEQELFHGTILCQRNLSFIILYDNCHWGNTDSVFDAQSRK